MKRRSFPVPVVPVLPLLALCLGGCKVSPAVNLSSRQTVLEQQASASFRQLEEDLDKAGVSPRAVPFTRGQVEGQGAEAERLAVAPEEEESDEEHLDRLLSRRCAGEAKDGTVVETRATCAIAVDPRQVGQLLERTNRGRWQVWRFLQGQRPSASMEQVQKEWRRAHLEAVVCKGQVQQDDGTWGAKECEEKRR